VEETITQRHLLEFVITSNLLIVNDLCLNYLFYKLRLSYMYGAKPVVHLAIVVYSVFSSF